MVSVEKGNPIEIIQHSSPDKPEKNHLGANALSILPAIASCFAPAKEASRTTSGARLGLTANELEDLEMCSLRYAESLMPRSLAPVDMGGSLGWAGCAATARSLEPSF